jgi:hypothetical protein
MLDYVLGSSQKIFGPKKTVEVDESNFGLRKYNRGHKVKGQWVFGGFERESGKEISRSLCGQTAGTPMAVLCDWFEPGTRVISDCWSA